MPFLSEKTCWAPQSLCRAGAEDGAANPEGQLPVGELIRRAARARARPCERGSLDESSGFAAVPHWHRLTRSRTSHSEQCFNPTSGRESREFFGFPWRDRSAASVKSLRNRTSACVGPVILGRATSTRRALLLVACAGCGTFRTKGPGCRSSGGEPGGRHPFLRVGRSSGRGEPARRGGGRAAGSRPRGACGRAASELDVPLIAGASRS